MDLSKLASEVAGLLMQRGAGLPPLDWQERSNPLAKKTLDLIDDAKLLGRDDLADESLAAAVRTLLYLWNGHVDDCKMYVQAAPQREQHLLTGICERQAGNVEAAKASFRQVPQHPIYEPLTRYAVEAIGTGLDAALGRFQQIVQLGEEWEPHAFVDLCIQARAGNLCAASEQAACSIQAKEFELLFTYCYEGATGERIPAAQQAPRPQPKKRRSKRASRSAHLLGRQTVASPKPSPKGPAKAKSADTSKPTRQPPPNTIGVLCPKCRTGARVPDKARGTVVRCGKCGANFLVPHKGGVNEPAAPAKAGPR